LCPWAQVVVVPAHNAGGTADVRKEFLAMTTGPVLAVSRVTIEVENPMRFFLYLVTGWLLLSIPMGVCVGYLCKLRDSEGMPGDFETKSGTLHGRAPVPVRAS
jgi:hypothetical protein